MTTRLNALADRLSSLAAFGLGNYDNLQADVNYLVVPGSDLASAATLAITNNAHGITGTTTITNITDALGASGLQEVELWIKNGPLTIQHNGSGGGGNIRTATGYDRKCYPGELIRFRYDVANSVWRECRPMSGARIAYGKATANVTTTGTTFAGGADLLASALNFNADGSSDYILKVSAVDASHSVSTAYWYLHANLDGADAGFFSQVQSPAANSGMPVAARALIVAPSAAAHTLNVRVRGGTAGTTTIVGGAGGANTAMPIVVTLEVA